jgi:hypothetical protein
MSSVKQQVEEVVPAAARTVESLRDVGYELPQAIADLIDNSIEAGATRIAVDVRFDEASESWIRIADNGHGMNSATLTESLRYGSQRDYGENDLGKFGFGLKTASTSQCRRVTVASRGTDRSAQVGVRTLDLDHIARTNKWEILVIDASEASAKAIAPLNNSAGTVVLWENLDRVLDYKDPFGRWAHKRMLELAEEVHTHLAMVFHRFLSGEVPGSKIEMTINGSNIEPWDPFCRDERDT